jgi:hypothetical protein
MNVLSEEQAGLRDAVRALLATSQITIGGNMAAARTICYDPDVPR